MDSLQLFDKETAEWFRGALGEPTPVQEAAWPAIAAGGHVLVSAPTGTGKTLSAFLVFLDRLKSMAKEGNLKRETQVIYVSPLKSLASDIRENLRRPLAGIGGEELVTVAVRTGDTTGRERQTMIKKPPHILIITPESLYLMLTGKAGRNVLATARVVILDELHALIDTKRGAHLMLSLARLDALCRKPLQRVGLSATLAPLSRAAEYLAPEAVTVVAPSMYKDMSLKVLGPYADSNARRRDPVWKELSALVYEYCQGNRSVIAFVEGRRYAEKLAYYVNQLGGEDFARVHHGSLSREQRQETEQSLREGKLRLLCATSSMELGIDVGEIDRVLQVGCPRSISGTMQRLGRAGHNPSRTSVMYLFPRTAAECVQCGMTARLAKEGQVENINPPEGCLDVLAQHLVSMAAVRGYEVKEVMEILPRAWPFRHVTREDVKALLSMLAGDYEHRRDIPVRPRILYDRIHERVEGDGYSRLLAVSGGGTIPDKGLYTVRTEEGVKVGEADEEFVYETRLGDRFLLGAFAWRVTNIGRDTVTVTQASVDSARIPFWKGELKGRSKETGISFGRIYSRLQEAEEGGSLEDALQDLGLDEPACLLAAGYLRRQIKAVGGLPDHRTILAEHFKDQAGNSQLMIHSVFGKRINGPLALLAARAAREELGQDVSSVDEEDGFLLSTYGDKALPEGILRRLNPETVLPVLSAMLPAAPIFNIAFRYNCGRALMMGVKGSGRQPLWMQRLKSAELLKQAVEEPEHPLIRETRQECLYQIWDAEGVRELLLKLRAGEILVREIYTDTPSPMSLPLQWSQEAANMYDYTPTPRDVQRAVEDALRGEKGLVEPGDAQLSQVQERGRLPENKQQLHSLLMAEGDLAAGELDIPVEWLEELAAEGRALYLEQGLWIAAEHEEEYCAMLGGPPEVISREESVQPEVGGVFLESQGNLHPGGADWLEKALPIVRRMLRYRGGATVLETAGRYGLSEEAAEGVLRELCSRQEAVAREESLQQNETVFKEESAPVLREESANGEKGDGAHTGIRYYHAELYRRALVRTLKVRREEIATCPPGAYAALLLSRIRRAAPPEECLRMALASLEGAQFSAGMWEEIILPARVKNYRGSLLDSLLATGEYFWRMEEGDLGFFSGDRIDWDSVPQVPGELLTEKEGLIAEALCRRGASFAQGLSGVLSGESPVDTLLALMEKGVARADSFVPVRLWLNREKAKRAPLRQQVGARVKALQAGRWELVRRLRECSVQEQMESCFDRYLILCRETAAACGLSWQEALALLRVQEYTGQVRRGYFVKGLSGAQFIRSRDFEAVSASLKAPERELLWLNAADPAQPWGRVLPHEPGRMFVNVPGTAVCFQGGVPVALFERQGRTFRVPAGIQRLEQQRIEQQKAGTQRTESPMAEQPLERAFVEEIIGLFAEDFRRERIFAGKKRLVVKEYPPETAGIFEKCGFIREMQDYTLYR